MARAITLATNLDYDKIKEKLYYTSKLLECEKLCVCCYQFLLTDYFKYDVYYNYKGMKIKDFIKQHNKGKYLIRIKSHLTCAINGVIYDIWDCNNEIADIVWKII